MQHKTICNELKLSYKHYTKLRNKYRFFAYITDLLTLDYVLGLSKGFVNELVKDLREALEHKGVLRGLDLVLFGDLHCFKADKLAYMQNLAEVVTHYQNHKWNYRQRAGAN